MIRDYSSEHTLIDCLHGTNHQTNDQPEPSSSSHQHLSIKKLQPPDEADASKVCVSIDNVLSLEECQTIIHGAEQAGFRDALVNVGIGEIHHPEVRNSQRCIIDDKDFAKCMYKRLEECLPKTLTRGYNNEWELVGLNERMRILRYDRGNFFASHSDGSYVKSVRERTFLTLMIYLNTGGGIDFEGGSTNFLSKRTSNRNGRNDSMNITKFVPNAGSILLFDHRLLHEGEEVISGSKYCIRTDVLYRKF